tara:strand:- start:93 stop:977 length:885 start_codon:yes stop_codon:yes gene_type:complete
MKKNSHLFLLIIALSNLCSCDIDVALLRGNKVEYIFPPGDSLDPYAVDSDKVIVMELVSKEDGENGVSPAMISGVYVGDTSKIAQDTIILYLHGNSGSLNGYWDPIRQMANIGGHHRYGVLAIDYRGFGNSEGISSSIFTMRQDLFAALDFLRDMGLEEDRLIVYGLSLGSLPSCQEAGDQLASLKINKLIIESPQSSANLFFQDATGLSAPSSMLTDYNFDLIESISKYNGQLQWMHGANDMIAPFENAKAIYDAHSGIYKESHILPLGGHYFRWDFGFENWGNVIHDFILNQ